MVLMHYLLIGCLAIPIEYQKKIYKCIYSITGLKTISCNSPITNPTILPVFLPLSKAIAPIIIRLVFGNTPNILK